VTAQAVIQQLAKESGQFEVELIGSLEGLEALSAERLVGYDLLFFANTSGELPLNDAQKQAILDFVGSGKGFLGTHSATDTFYEWAAYGALIGAYFDSHPWVQEATIDVEDAAHPANAKLPTSYNLMEEYYTFRQNPRPHVHVLQSLNAASVNTTGDYPLVWCKSYGEGRVYYNALGHFDETWLDPRFQSQLLGAMQWATGLNDAPCPESKALYLPLIARY
jgi:type 1 glutamine amidotransferase